MADLMKVITPKRDIARELARKYSTMTHDELDVLEDLLVPVKYGKALERATLFTREIYFSNFCKVIEDVLVE